MDEKEMVEELFRLKSKKKIHEDSIKEINKNYDSIENKLHELMVLNNQKTTAAYNGFGKIEIGDIETHASVDKENNKLLVEWLKEKGYENSIGINHKTFSSIISAILQDASEANVKADLPDFIKIFQKQRLKLKKERE